MSGYRRPGARAHRSSGYLFAAMGAILAVVVIGVITFSLCGGSGGDPVVSPTTAVTQAPTESPAPTREPSATPTEEPAAHATVEATPAVAAARAYQVVKPTPLEDGYLPIYSKAETNERIIAVTVDDFFQSDNARAIIDAAIASGAKLTLFPIGKNVLREELRDTLIYAHENGMEIENHTFEHRPLYKMTDEAMARQIYLQCLALDYVLGVDYQEHFFRPGGGDGRDDQRTHLYIKQLGMYGIAHWTLSGSQTALPRLLETLAPGNIYLFHTTDSDMEKLLEFIPAAMEAGYTLVTLNEMYGLPENEVSELAGPIDIRDIPQIEPYTLNPRTYVKGDYQWTAFLIQQRLIELGYLTGKPDGIYGESTYTAVGNFQKASGLPATGDADPATQDALFSQE